MLFQISQGEMGGIMSTPLRIVMDRIRALEVTAS